jgi:hypothetical protein
LEEVVLSPQSLSTPFFDGTPFTQTMSLHPGQLPTPDSAVLTLTFDAASAPEVVATPPFVQWTGSGTAAQKTMTFRVVNSSNALVRRPMLQVSGNSTAHHHGTTIALGNVTAVVLDRVAVLPSGAEGYGNLQSLAKATFNGLKKFGSTKRGRQRAHRDWSAPARTSHGSGTEHQ